MISFPRCGNMLRESLMLIIYGVQERTSNPFKRDFLYIDLVACVWFNIHHVHFTTTHKGGEYESGKSFFFLLGECSHVF